MMSRNSRILRSSLVGLGIALGVLVVSAVGVFLFLLTPPGENLLRRVALDRINDIIAGEAEIANLEFTGGTLGLQGLVLRSPQGEEIVHVERVFVDFAFAPLLSGEVHFDRFEVSDYSVHLRRLDDGRWNLAAALEREEPIEDEDPEEDRIPFVVDEFELRGGAIDVHTEAAGEVRRLRLENIGATGFLALRERVLGTVDLRAYATAPAEAPVVLHAQSRIENETQHVELLAWMGGAVIESRVQLPSSDAEVDIGQIDGWLGVDAPAFSLADFTYGPVRLAAHVSNGRLVVPTAHAELPGSTLSSTMHEGDTRVRVTLSVDDLETTARAVGALLPLELPEVSGQGEVQLHLDNPIDVPSLGLVVRMGRIGVGDTELTDLRLETSLHELDLSLAASVAEPYRAAMRVEGTFTDARRETLRLEHIALAYPDTRWTNPAPALVHMADSGSRVEGLSLVSEDQRIDADVQWTDTTRVARVQLSSLRLSSVPKALHPPDLTFGGMLDGDLELRRPEDEPEASVELRLTRGRLAGASGISARLNAVYADERLRGGLTSSLLSGTANAEFDLPAIFPPPEGTALDARIDLHGVALEEAWRAAQGVLPDALAERLERASGRLGLSASLDGTWPEPNLRGRLTMEDGSLSLTEIGRIRGIELLLEGNEDHVHLRTLRASTEEGSLTASGEARRVGAEPRYRYRLRVSADQFPVSLEDPVSATLEARIAGEITPDEVTSEVQAEDVRVLRPEPPPPSPDDEKE